MALNTISIKNMPVLRRCLLKCDAVSAWLIEWFWEDLQTCLMIGVTLLKVKRFLRNLGCTYHALRRHDIEKNVRTSC